MQPSDWTIRTEKKILKVWGCSLDGHTLRHLTHTHFLHKRKYSDTLNSKAFDFPKSNKPSLVSSFRKNRQEEENKKVLFTLSLQTASQLLFWIYNRLFVCYDFFNPLLLVWSFHFGLKHRVISKEFSSNTKLPPKPDLEP